MGNAVFAGTPAEIPVAESNTDKKLSEDASLSNVNESAHCSQKLSCIEDPSLVTTIKNDACIENVNCSDINADSAVRTEHASDTCLSDRLHGESLNKSSFRDPQSVAISASCPHTAEHSCNGTEMAGRAGKPQDEDTQEASEWQRPTQASDMDASLRSSRKGLGATNASYGEDFEDYGSEDDFEEESADAS